MSEAMPGQAGTAGWGADPRGLELLGAVRMQAPETKRKDLEAAVHIPM